MSDSETLTVKVFPLPSAVLFPFALLPLHIFEPRYRHLVREALASDSLLALGQLEPGWEADYEGRPPLKSLCTLGSIVWSEKLADGRYNILVRGITRAQILSEGPPAHAYREVVTQLCADPSYVGPEDEALRSAVLELATRMPAAVSNELVEASTQASGGALADVVAAAVVPGLEQRWRLLCERDVRSRLQLVLNELGEALARLPVASPEKPLN